MCDYLRCSFENLYSFCVGVLVLYFLHFIYTHMFFVVHILHFIFVCTSVFIFNQTVIYIFYLGIDCLPHLTVRLDSYSCKIFIW